MDYRYTSKNEIDKKLFEALSKEELITKLNNCKTPEECFEVTLDYVPGITFTEYQDAMKSINENIEESKDGLLSETDMMQVAGGCHTCEIVTAGAAVVGAAATAAGAAA